ncbi:hypothetical protein GCM10029978_082510 [Actinoallomurus acanthiterrae]
MGGAGRRFGRTVRLWLASGAVVATMAATVSSDVVAPPPSGRSEPEFAVSVEGSGPGWAQVLEASTSRVLGEVPAPSSAIGRPVAVVAAAADRTFVLAASDPARCVSRLYRLRLSEQGDAEKPRPIPGGPIRAAVAGLAVDPYDSKIAYATAPCGNTAAPHASVTVLDTLTGEHRIWSLDTPSVVGDLRWGSDGRTLGYALGQGVPAQVGFTPTTGTVRALDTTTRGTSLLAGRVVYRPADGVLESASLDRSSYPSIVVIRDPRSGDRSWFSVGLGRSPRLLQVIPAGTAVFTAMKIVGRLHQCGGDVDAFGRLIDGRFTSDVRGGHLACTRAQ